MSRADSGAFALVSMKKESDERVVKLASASFLPLSSHQREALLGECGRGVVVVVVGPLKALMLNLVTGCFCELYSFLQRSRPSVKIRLNNLHFIEGKLDEREERPIINTSNPIRTVHTRGRCLPPSDEPSRAQNWFILTSLLEIFSLSGS